MFLTVDVRFHMLLEVTRLVAVGVPHPPRRGRSRRFVTERLRPLHRRHGPKRIVTFDFASSCTKIIIRVRQTLSPHRRLDSFIPSEPAYSRSVHCRSQAALLLVVYLCLRLE